MKRSLTLSGFFLSLFFLKLIFATPVFAQGCPVVRGGGCYDWDNPPSFGCYVDCAIGPAFNIAQIILVAITIVFTLIMIFKTATAVGNSQKLQELPMRWVYVLLLGLVATGAAGTAINILLKFFGFGGVAHWLKPFDDLLIELR